MLRKCSLAVSGCIRRSVASSMARRLTSTPPAMYCSTSSARLLRGSSITCAILSRVCGVAFPSVSCYTPAPPADSFCMGARGVIAVSAEPLSISDQPWNTFDDVQASWATSLLMASAATDR